MQTQARMRQLFQLKKRKKKLLSSGFINLVLHNWCRTGNSGATAWTTRVQPEADVREHICNNTELSPPECVASGGKCSSSVDLVKCSFNLELCTARFGDDLCRVRVSFLQLLRHTCWDAHWEHDRHLCTKHKSVHGERRQPGARIKTGAPGKRGLQPYICR